MLWIRSRSALRAASILALASALATGCGEPDAQPAEPAEASARLDGAIPTLSQAIDDTGTALSSQRFTDLDFLTSTVSKMAGQDGGDVVVGTARSLGKLGADGDSDGSSLEAIAEDLFTEENYEGNGVYLVPPSLVCDAADLECIDQVTQAELRVRVVLAGDDGLDITLLVGPDRDAPLFVELRPTSIAATIDLAETADAASFMASITGDSINLPSTFEGRIRGMFEVLDGGAGARATIGITQAIAIVGDIDGQDVSIEVAARDPMYSLTVDFEAPSVALEIDVGPMTLEVPLTAIDGEATTDDTVVVDWKGASGSVVLDSSETLSLTNLGLGDGTSTVSVGDDLLLAIDVNADAGRRYDMTLSAGELGPRVELDPGLTVELYVDSSVVDDAAPAHLSGVTYTAAVTGTNPTLEVIDTGLDSLIKVVSGNIAISASDSAESVEVAAGDCLIGDLEPEVGAHPVLGTMASIVCPVTLQ